jgi:hypothetical protein
LGAFLDDGGVLGFGADHEACYVVQEDDGDVPGWMSASEIDVANLFFLCLQLVALADELSPLRGFVAVYDGDSVADDADVIACRPC